MSNTAGFPVLAQYGSCVLGAYIGAIIYGSTALQLFQYFRKFRGDKIIIRILVLVAFILDTFGMGSMIFVIFEATIVHWGDANVFNPGPEADWLARLFAGRTFEAVAIVPLIQSFWLWRIWSLSRASTVLKTRWRRILIITFLITMVAAEFGAMLTYAIQSTRFALKPLQLKGYTTCATALMASTDVCLAATMTCLLHRARTGYQRTDLVVNSLIIYSLANGLFTAAMTLITLALFLIKPMAWVWIGTFFIQERLYMSSLLASLNIRSALRNPTSTDLEKMDPYRLRLPSRNNTEDSLGPVPEIDTIKFEVRTGVIPESV